MKIGIYWKRICSLLLVLLLFPIWGSRASAEDGGLLEEERLNQWMDAYVRDKQLDGSYETFSVGFCYTATGESWYYNADQWMYSASLYKVPVAMLMAEKEAAGELTQDSTVMGMPLQYWESTALTYSNNDSGHAMVTYLGGTYLGKCSELTIPYTDLNEDYFNDDFYQTSYYTARYMTQVMRTLYEGGEERFPHIVEYLLPAQPDSYLNLSLKDRFAVAQKYGSYEEPNGNKNNHIAAIVYTPNPVIITVMTRNVGDYQERMAEVGAYLTDYALELDAKAEERKAQAEAERLAREEEERRLAEQQSAASEAPAVAETEAPQPAQETPVGSAEKQGAPLLLWLIPAVLAAAVIVAVVLLLRGSGRRRRPVRYRRDYADDEAQYEEPYEDGENEYIDPYEEDEARFRRETVPASRAERRERSYTPRH